MAEWLHHLFETQGFPTITNYGQSWEPWLIVVFVACKGVTLASYVFLLAAFIRAAIDVHAGRISEAAARVHMPRVIAFYCVHCFFSVLREGVQIAGFWWPAYRFIAVFVALDAMSLLAASIKTVWAYIYCVNREMMP